jgi:hypothetical protein
MTTSAGVGAIVRQVPVEIGPQIGTTIAEASGAWNRVLKDAWSIGRRLEPQERGWFLTLQRAHGEIRGFEIHEAITPVGPGFGNADLSDGVIGYAYVHTEGNGFPTVTTRMQRDWVGILNAEPMYVRGITDPEARAYAQRFPMLREELGRPRPL